MTGALGPNIQAVGFQQQAGLTRTYLHKGYVDTAKIIEIMDDFYETIEKTTVAAFDNASSHTSNAFSVVRRTLGRERLANLLPATL